LQISSFRCYEDGAFDLTLFTKVFSIMNNIFSDTEVNAPPVLYYARVQSQGGQGFDLLMHATSPQEAAQQLLDYYEFEDAADLESMVSVAAVPRPASTTVGPIDWDFLNKGIHILPDTLNYARSTNEENGENGKVITVAIPLSINADGQLVFDGEFESALSFGSDDDLGSAIKAMMVRLGIQPAPLTNITDRPICLWIDYILPAGTDFREVETAFREALLPLGLVETGSGGWIGDRAGERDISFQIPAGTDLSRVRDMMEATEFGVAWSHSLDEIDPEDLIDPHEQDDLK
jgi:hypothetical protein